MKLLGRRADSSSALLLFAAAVKSVKEKRRYSMVLYYVRLKWWMQPSSTPTPLETLKKKGRRLTRERERVFKFFQRVVAISLTTFSHLVVASFLFYLEKNKIILFHKQTLKIYVWVMHRPLKPHPPTFWLLIGKDSDCNDVSSSSSLLHQLIYLFTKESLYTLAGAHFNKFPTNGVWTRTSCNVGEL